MIQFDLFTTHQSAPTVTDHKTVLHGQFYNTNNLSGEELKEKRRKVAGQTAKILKVFEDHPHTTFSPWDLYYHFGQQLMITSIRRAITDLTSGGHLEKCDRKRSGPANEWNWTWKFKG
jgi:hypothetical protein